MKPTIKYFALFLIINSGAYCQAEMDKFYSYYHVDNKLKKSCDSVYKLIEERRSDFSKEYRTYKETNSGAEGFMYDWSKNEKQILPFLKNEFPKPLKHLLYYSYFDLGYGALGLELDAKPCKTALKEIEPASAIWATEPSLLEVVIKYEGGEDKYITYIKRVINENKDKNVIAYCWEIYHLSGRLKQVSPLSELQYKDFSDTTKILTSNLLRGKYF